MSEKTVTLSDGRSIEVRPIRWSAWQDVKAAFARLVGSKLIPEVFRGLDALDSDPFRPDGKSDDRASGEVIAGFLTGVFERHQEGLAYLLADAIRDGGELAELFIAGCAVDVVVSDLSAIDALSLAEHAINASDLSGLLGREKNFWAAVVSAATSGTRTGTTAA